MKRFFDTVNDDWWSPIADQLASPWFTGDHMVRVLRASANFVCKVEADGLTYYLRFSHSSERDPVKIDAEIKYILHLIGKGVKANKPVQSLSGNYVESIPTGLGVFHTVLFEAVPGEHLESADLDIQGFHRWGEVLGDLHEASAGYLSDVIPSWRAHVAYVRIIVPDSEHVVLNELALVESALNEFHIDESSYGVIHYDFEMDNICWKDGVPGFMDFDDCFYQWYAADIVYALRDLFNDKIDKINIQDERFQSFLKGYKSIRPISDEGLRNIPLQFRLQQPSLICKNPLVNK